jgi:hypothetical protein
MQGIAEAGLKLEILLLKSLTYTIGGPVETVRLLEEPRSERAFGVALRTCKDVPILPLLIHRGFHES